MLLLNLNLLATAPGGVARLRELILTLAVQGKLVPQDPADEPASVLLEKIGAEKERLIAAGTIKRGKVLAAIDEDERPFTLPVSWLWTRVGDITNYGSPLKASAIQPETWVLDMEDIEKSSGRLVQRLRSAERPALSDKNCFSKDDVLYGKLRPYLNKVLVADEDGVCTTEIMPFRCYGEYVPQYLRLALSSPFFLDYVNVRSYGMKMPRLGTEDARKAVFPLPPLAEQSRIVTRVEELMQLCDALEAKGRLESAQHARLVSTLLATLTDSPNPEALAENWQRVSTHFDLLLDRPEAVDALEQTLLQLAVRGLLVPQDPQDEPASALIARIRIEKDRLIAEGKIKRDKPLAAITEDEKPFGLPVGWEWARLGDICLQVTDGTHQTPKYTDVGRPFLSAKNVKPFRFMPTPHRFVSESDFHDLRKGRAPAVGDILMTRVGAMIGEAAVIDSDIEFAFYVSLALLSLPKSHLSPEFIVNWLNSPFGTTNSVEKTLGRGVSAGNLNLTFIRSFAIPLPPLAEQSRIVARVASLRRLCADLRQRLAAGQATQAQFAHALLQGAA